MYTVKLTIAYDGTEYRGWQLQKNGNTVQAELEKAIENVLGSHRRVHSSSRTDAGVHAKGQVAHFSSPVEIPGEKIPGALNGFLPKDISVVKAEYVADNFHSRFDAKSKHYRYYMITGRERDPFRERYSWRVPYKINDKAMKEAAKVLVGKHDFRSFQASDKKERSSVRTVSRLELSRKQGFLLLDIEADGFLYNMVRNITGTLVDFGRGYCSNGEMQKILRSRDRARSGPTAPAAGLFLLEVRY